MALKSNVSEILKQLREISGKTQTEVGEALGRSGAWVSYIENSARNIKASDLGDLADFYHADISIFYDTPYSTVGVGLLIEKALNKANVTIKELSDGLNLDYFRISKCIEGEIDLTPEELEKIGKYLNINEPPFSSPSDYWISRILALSNYLGLSERKIEMLQTFLKDEAKK